MEWHEDLEAYCTQASLRGKKVTKVKNIIINSISWLFIKFYLLVLY